MAERLTLRNFKAVVASSGAEALAQLEKIPELDVVVLDIRMPGMDGIETLQEIKKKQPLLEIIILTGYPTVKTSVEAMKNGAFEYLEKPYDIEQLVATIKAALARKRKFEDRIFAARIKPYSSERERQRLITGLVDEAAGRGRRSTENEEK
jgi:DNA-binding NtrC family response regulator